MYQPRPGQISTTVWFGRTPKNRSVSSGWRYWSRTVNFGVREGLAIAAASGSWASAATALTATAASVSSNAARPDSVEGTALSPAMARDREAAILLPPGVREDAIVPS